MKNLRGIGILLLILFVAMLSGCQEAQKWGQGDPPAEWQTMFGNGNLSRLNFVQTDRINKLNADLEALTELNSEQHKKLGETDIMFHGRIEALEGIDIITVNERDSEDTLTDTETDTEYNWSDNIEVE